jgi:ubiquinone/menaquinone biosynthesis C-methylase UbiE
MNDFSKTPSFYNSQEVFKKYLGQTSYYLALQNTLFNLIEKIKPKHILELGFGTGQTAVMVANKNPKAKITAVDMRKEMINVAQNLAKENDVANIDFLAGDMTKFVSKNLNKFDVMYFVYSFHHIEDPLDNKIKFLEDCYKNMKKGGYICIGETFIPENYSMEKGDVGLLKFFEIRGEEGYASTFWKSLTSLSEDDIAYSEKVASYCKQMEIDAGKLVSARKDEYLVQRSWLKNLAEKIGFTTIIDKQVNNIGDAIMLFQK